MQKFFGEKLKGHKRRRLRKLAAMLCGLMFSKKPSMIALGSGLPQKIKAYSKEKEAKKFLENRFINLETYYQPYIKEIVKDINFFISSYREVMTALKWEKTICLNLQYCFSRA